MTPDKKVNDSFNPIEKLQITSGLLTKYADRIFTTEIGISQSKYVVLSAIYSFKSPVNQSRVAEIVQRNLNSISMMVDRLVKSDMVIRTRSSEDRRENYLALTPEGRKIVTRGQKVSESLNKRLLSMLNEKEVKELQNILNTLEKSIINEIR